MTVSFCGVELAHPVINGSGTFDAIVVEPFVRKEGIFVQKGKSLKVWLTDDARRMPIYLAVEVFFGSISAALVKVDGAK